LVAGAGIGVLWPSATVGAAANAAATKEILTRKIALIRSRSLMSRRFTPPRRATANARRVPDIQALGR